ncbi:MAG: kdsB [Bacteroidota bacterium]|jgi:3-deoxy-manno-octulosonate cytidylyltransferase (CMP-KDO synthetase)|nr:kdsB [Bacteroidota bacterium]
MNPILGIIPARYASTRFPGKPLIDILGKSMLQRVYEQAKKSTYLREVVVATDDERIYSHVESFGGKAIYTKTEHPSGTDRCYEAYQSLGENFEYVVNIQGDEPFIDPSQIDLICSECTGNTQLATLMIPVDSHEVLFDMGEVKITLNSHLEALYFSRMVIPFIKGKPQEEWHKHHTYYRHVGMYAYRTDILEQITQLKPSSLENAESLEQLRWLENGYKVKCAITHFDSHCIDTPEDIEKVIRLMNIK